VTVSEAPIRRLILRVLICELSGRTFLPVVAHFRVNDPDKVIDVVRLANCVTNSFGRTQPFDG
jgi:hypothetical protein